MNYSLEYIAGFFDGEGSVGIYRSSSSRGYTLRVQLGQNLHDQTAKFFAFLSFTYGGSISSQRTSSGNMKLNWQVSGSEAAKFLDVIALLTHFKTAQIQVALEWYRGRQVVKRQPNGRIKSHALSELRRSEKAAAQLKDLKTSIYQKG